MDSDLGVYYLDYNAGNITFSVIDSSSVMRISPVYHIFDKTKNSFFIELTSIKGDFEVSVNASNARPRKSVVTLSEGETKKLYVDYNDTSSFGNIQLSYDIFSYNVNLFPVGIEPILDDIEEVVVDNETEEVIIVPEVKVPLTFLLSNPNATIYLGVNQSVAAILKVQNTFGENIENLNYNLIGDIVNIVSYRSEIVNLEDGEILETEFIFNYNENASVGTYNGEIVFGNEDYEISLPVVVIVNIEDEEVSDSNLVLGEDIIFEGQILNEESGNGLLIIGIVLVVLMLFLIIVVIIKLRQNPEKRFNQFIEETKKK